MALDRREALRALGAAGVVALAGCSSSDRLWGSSPATRITPEDGTARAKFGSSVAMGADGATALVGAPRAAAPDGRKPGAAYVFSAADGGWRQESSAAVADDEDGFGEAVTVSADGTTALVGVPRDDVPGTPAGGSCHVFSVDDGGWRKQATLTASDAGTAARFGRSVAVSADGTTGFVLAPLNEDPGGGYGTMYVFEAGVGWSQQDKLTPSDADKGDLFGGSMAASAGGTTAIVGAPRDKDSRGITVGAAYVFADDGGGWRQQTTVTPDDGNTDAAFGSSVALASDGATAVVGSPNHEVPTGGTESGAAFVFSKRGRGWHQQAALAPADGGDEDEFGASVALSADGSTAIVGAPEAGNGHGAAYVFRASGGTWDQQKKLAPAAVDSSDGFGEAVTVSADGTTALVGVPFDADSEGSAYVVPIGDNAR